MHVYRGPRPATRKFANLELRGITSDGTFSGYASVFGEVDLGQDVIERGAFRRSIAPEMVASFAFSATARALSSDSPARRACSNAVRQATSIRAA